MRNWSKIQNWVRFPIKKNVLKRVWKSFDQFKFVLFDFATPQTDSDYQGFGQQQRIQKIQEKEERVNSDRAQAQWVISLHPHTQPPNRMDILFFLRYKIKVGAWPHPSP